MREQVKQELQPEQIKRNCTTRRTRYADTQIGLPAKLESVPAESDFASVEPEGLDLRAQSGSGAASSLGSSVALLVRESDGFMPATSPYAQMEE